jgi:hypothetical protein
MHTSAKRARILALAAASCAISNVLAQDAPVIRAVVPMQDIGALAIIGDNLPLTNKTLSVRLGPDGEPGDITAFCRVSAPRTVISCSFPGGLPQDGDYRLLVGGDGGARFDVTLGATGLPGPAGAIGPTGPAGPAGAAGPAGPAGTPGGPGPVGPEGPVGDAGQLGPAGAAGTMGPAGVKGPNGPVGIEGARGPMGPIGDVGATGATGPTGTTGAAGPQGAVGTAGIDGPIGATGAPGPSGPTGAPGGKGAPGAPGAPGPAGVPGNPGPAGATGPQGPAGAAGLPGIPGPMGPVGPAGQVGPQGPRGASGPAGTTGPKGVPGDAGQWRGYVNRDEGSLRSTNWTLCTLGEVLLSSGGNYFVLVANGQLLQISEWDALFSLFGTTYGGDGETTFGLPDLSDLAPRDLTYGICAFGIYPQSN